MNQDKKPKIQLCVVLFFLATQNTYCAETDFVVIKFALLKHSSLYSHVELPCKLSDNSVNKRDFLKIINLYLKSNHLVDYPKLFRGFHNIHNW